MLCNRISLGKFWRPAVDHRRFYAWSVKPVSTLSAWSTSQKHSGRLIMRILNKTFVVNSWWSFFTPHVGSIYVLQRKLDMMSWSCDFERITWVLKVMCLQAAQQHLCRVHINDLMMHAWISRRHPWFFWRILFLAMIYNWVIRVWGLGILLKISSLQLICSNSGHLWGKRRAAGRLGTTYTMLFAAEDPVLSDLCVILILLLAISATVDCAICLFYCSSRSSDHWRSSSPIDTEFQTATADDDDEYRLVEIRDLKLVDDLRCSRWRNMITCPNTNWASSPHHAAATSCTQNLRLNPPITREDQVPEEDDILVDCIRILVVRRGQSGASGGTAFAAPLGLPVSSIHRWRRFSSLIINVFRPVAPPAAAVDQEYASKTLGHFSRGGGGRRRRRICAEFIKVRTIGTHLQQSKFNMFTTQILEIPGTHQLRISDHQIIMQAMMMIIIPAAAAAAAPPPPPPWHPQINLQQNSHPKLWF